MTDWEPVFVLPNIKLAESIDAKLAVLAAIDDGRVASLRQSQPTFDSFISRFTDAFGEKLAPTVLLVRADALETFGIEALSSFRDAIAIATVAYNRALELKSPRKGGRVLFGNAFAFYPWMTDRNDEYLICRTLGIGGLHDVTAFRGQSSPELFCSCLDLSDVDVPLLDELLDRWRRCYGEPARSWCDIALFRSLNMAHNASLLPAASDETFYDVGRLISLWISAFEILVHPGGDGKANRDKVFDLLERINWEDSRCAEKRFPTGRQQGHRSLASWLYQSLYDRRNDFLHGNPVKPSALQLREFGPNLFCYAAQLYRMALTAFLPLALRADIPSASDTEAFAEYTAEGITFSDYQQAYEDALLTAQPSPP